MVSKAVVISLSIIPPIVLFGIIYAIFYYLGVLKRRRTRRDEECHSIYGIFVGILLSTVLSIAIYFGVYPKDFNCTAAILISVILSVEVFLVVGWASCLSLVSGAFEKGGACFFLLLCVLLPGGIGCAATIIALGAGLGYHYC